MTKFTVKKKGSLQLDKKTIELVNLLERGLPIILGNEAVNFFKSSFKKGGWTDKTFNPWQPRKVPDIGRAILVKSGDLRRSIVKNVAFKRVTISTNVSYASKHNFGLGRMPKRQFIGDSAELKKQMSKTIEREMNKLL